MAQNVVILLSNQAKSLSSKTEDSAICFLLEVILTKQKLTLASDEVQVSRTQIASRNYEEKQLNLKQ